MGHCVRFSKLNPPVSSIFGHKKLNFNTHVQFFIAPDVTMAMLVIRIRAKKSFGNLTLLLCKT